ncbi:MAG: CBS domain-containing protein [Methanomicrobiaceae archaeon]|nr:CBS domain-containing protein [Methanomicrobiaceae archaeon]
MNDDLLIKDIMSKPIAIAKSAVITEALDKMLDEAADPLIVTNNGSVVGTISRKAIADTLGSKKTSTLSPTQIHVANRIDEAFTSAYPDEPVDVLIPLLQEYKIVVILDSDHKLIGKVDATDLLKVIKPDVPAEKIMQVPHTIHPGERVVHLRRRMLDEDVTKFVVTDDGGIVGVVTETDIARSLREFRSTVEDNHQEHRVRNLYVSDIMTSPALTVKKDAVIDEVVDILVNRNISSIPVVNDQKLVGLISKESLIVAL